MFRSPVLEPRPRPLHDRRMDLVGLDVSRGVVVASCRSGTTLNRAGDLVRSPAAAADSRRWHRLEATWIAERILIATPAAARRRRALWRGRGRCTRHRAR